MKIFLISNLNLPWCSLSPLPHTLGLVTWEKQNPHLHKLPTGNYLVLLPFQKGSSSPPTSLSPPLPPRTHTKTFLSANREILCVLLVTSLENDLEIKYCELTSGWLKFKKNEKKKKSNLSYLSKTAMESNWNHKCYLQHSQGWEVQYHCEVWLIFRSHFWQYKSHKERKF